MSQMVEKPFFYGSLSTPIRGTTLYADQHMQRI